VSVTARNVLDHFLDARRKPASSAKKGQHPRTQSRWWWISAGDLNDRPRVEGWRGIHRGGTVVWRGMRVFEDASVFKIARKAGLGQIMADLSAVWIRQRQD